jgi:hypothetical protein
VRQTIATVGSRPLLTVTVAEVIAAGVNTVAPRNHFYRAAPAGIAIAVPSSMKSFPTEVLPQ